MGLMCECDYDGDWEPGMKLWHGPKDYTTLATKRSRKCCSCGDRIDVGATCAEVRRTKVPETEIEIRIYDAEVPISPKWMCERCAGLAFSLDELGYCGQPWEDQRELVREYAEMHHPAPNASSSQANEVSPCAAPGSAARITEKG